MAKTWYRRKRRIYFRQTT